MNYISIPKFAEQVGITRQAIYKRLRKEDAELMQYIKKEGNQTKIATEAKVLFDIVNHDGNCEQDFVNQNDNSVNSNGNSEPNSVNYNDDFVNSEPTFVNQNDNSVNSNGNSEPKNGNFVNSYVNSEPQSVNHVNHELQQIIEGLQAEKLEMSKQISSLIEVQNKHLNQIENLYSQIKDKDKLIEQLSTQILNQTRLPVIVEPPKQSIWQKLKFKLFKK